MEPISRNDMCITLAISLVDLAEEGLDIPEVDLVVFYEPIPSEIRYIQRRGRTGRKSAGSVVILAAKDTIDERYLYASKRRTEKMKEILSSVSPTLKSIQRTAVLTNPMTADEVSSFELKRIVLDERVDKILLSQPDAAKLAEPLASLIC